VFDWSFVLFNALIKSLMLFDWLGH